MNLQVKKEARQVILDSLAVTGEAIVEIEHDTDGCGCVVSGVARLVQLVEKPEKYETLTSDLEGVTFVMDPQVSVFFDTDIIIDHQNGRLQLKSPNEMLNPRLKLVPLSA
ncbi:iron-sulfur cluster biosynthesis family protein [Alteribacter natronophilus]|uniref:iron-sulfur cluster biosynthesis family protein n=1 Tax=Alteribacter natronophilus TaxID=2583810 RepID=UPI001486CC97|nr:iron-sulfur cluster biosynthesis family protein [Alteribacter natronophilus]